MKAMMSRNGTCVVDWTPCAFQRQKWDSASSSWSANGSAVPFQHRLPGKQERDSQAPRSHRFSSGAMIRHQQGECPHPVDGFYKWKCLVGRSPVPSRWQRIFRFYLPVSGRAGHSKRLHFSTPFTNNNRNSQQNTPEEYHQERPESHQDKLNYSPDYCD
jgi:hypothetical protein